MTNLAPAPFRSLIGSRAVASPQLLLFLAVRTVVSSGTLAFAYMFPAPGAMAGLAPASRLACRSHMIPLRYRAESLLPVINGLNDVELYDELD